MPPRQILIVDQDAHVLREAAEHLQQAGFSPVACNSAETALTTIAGHMPDALLLDASVAAASGLELLHHLREDARTKNLPILILSANRQNQHVVQALADGANDFVSKPIDYELLLARLQAQLDAYDRTRRLELRLELLLKRGSSDEVTGTPDRQLAMNALEAEVRRAARYRRPLSVLMIEVDHGKKLLDEHGETIFNGMLRHVAAVMSFTMRSSDVLARFHDGCFCAILPETDAKQAMRTGDRLRHAVEYSPYRFDGGAVRSTLSVGSANYLGSGLATAPMELVSRAEKALHLAQKGGSNQVQAFDGAKTIVDSRAETRTPKTE